MGLTWYTSDWHLGHVNIRKYKPERRAHFGPDVQAMDEGMIQVWNAHIGPEDEVFIVGDLCLGDMHQSLANAARLQGKKYLIPGNHDRVHPFSATREKNWNLEKWMNRYEEAGITTLPGIMDRQIGDFHVQMCHFPRQDRDTRYVQWLPETKECFLIHGHHHSGPQFNGLCINVAYDIWGLPVEESVLIAYMEEESARRSK